MAFAQLAMRLKAVASQVFLFCFMLLWGLQVQAQIPKGQYNIVDGPTRADTPVTFLTNDLVEGSDSDSTHLPAYSTETSSTGLFAGGCPSPNPFQVQHFGTGAAGLTPATLNDPVYADGIWAGMYVRVHVVSGNRYKFSTVGSEQRLIEQFGHVNNGFPAGAPFPNISMKRPQVDHDPIITIYDNTGSTANNMLSGNVLAFNEDASPTEPLNEFEFTATYTGEILVALDLQPGTIVYNAGTGPPNVQIPSAPADCGTLFQDSTSMAVTWIPAAPAMQSAAKDSDTQITITFDDNVLTNGGNPTDFTVTDGLGTNFVVSAQADGVAGDANIVLTVADLSSAIGDLRVTYTNNNDEISDLTGVDKTSTDATGVVIDVDTGPPTLSGATKDSDTQITVTLSEQVQTNGTNPTDFTVTDGQGTGFTVTAQADGTANDTDIVLTVNDMSGAVGDLTVTYTNNNGEISDFGSNELATDATGLTIDLDTTVPTISSAVKDSDTQITVTFSEVVQTNGTNPADFSVTDGIGSSFTVTAQADGTANDTDIVLTVNDVSAAVGDLTVTYTNNNDEISDFGGNSLATDATGVSIDLDVTAPTVVSVSKDNDTQVTVTFSEPVQIPDGDTPFANFILKDGLGTTYAASAVADGTANDNQLEVTVADLSGAVGDLTLTYDSSQDEGAILDFGGNVVADNLAGVTDDIDTTHPTMVSGVRDSDTQLTITFSEPVQIIGDSPDDFTVKDANSTPFAVSQITDGTAQDDKIILTVADFSTAVAPLTVTYEFDCSDISDFGGNALQNDLTGVDVQLTPTLSGATLDNTTQITVSFSDNVQTNGTNPTDFTVTDGQGTTFTVAAQADGTAGDTDIVLTVSDVSVAVGDLTITYTNNNNEISDAAGGSAFVATDAVGVVIDTDTTAPALSNAVQNDNTTITLTFSEDIQTNETNPTDFTVTDGQGTAFTVTAQADGTANDTDLVLTVNDMSAAVGDLTVTYTNNNNEISDFGGNDLATDATGVAIDLDSTVPTVSSIVRQDPTAERTNESTVTFRVTFSELVDNVDITDFSISGAGAGGTASITGVATETANTVFDITIETIDTEGELDLDFDAGQDISDFGGNAFAGTITSEETYTIDLTRPTITSITRNSPASEITNANSVVFRVTLSEEVTNAGTKDFELSGDAGGGTAAVTAVSTQALSTVIDVTVSTIDTDGELDLDIFVFHSLTDEAGNHFAGTITSEETYTIDNTAPSLSSATKDSDTQITVTLDEVVQTNGTNPTDFAVTDGLGNTYAVSNQADGTADDTDLILTVADLSGATGDLTVTYTNNNNEISDLAGNSLGTDATGVSIDTDATSPAMVSGVRDSDTQITLTFSEPVQTNEGNPTDFTVVDANSTPFVVSAQADGTANDTEIVLTVADFSGATGPLTVTYTNSNNEISDFGGNDLATDATGVEVALNAVVTAVSVPADDSYMAGEELSFTVTFDRAVTITGTPRIPLTIGAANVNASLSGTVSNATEATFVYTVQAGEEDTDGIALGTAIDLNGATIQDADNLDAIPDLNNIAATTQVLVDAIAPAAPVILSISDDTGDSDSDQITNDQSLFVRGTAEANSRLSLLVDGEGVFGGVTIIVDGEGNWEFSPVGEGEFTLEEGMHTYTATTEDAAGNESPVSEDFDVTIDLTAPAAPTLDFDASTDLGTSDSDNLTSGDNGLSYSGTAEPNSTVYLLFVDENDNPVEESGTSEPIAVDGNGNWSYQVNEAPAFTVIPLAAIATDAAGNTSPQSATVTVTIDTELAISSTSPTDNETDVLPNANLTVTFDKNVVKGTGNIQIIQSSNDQVQQTIDVTGDNVTINGATVTIDPASNILPPDTEFYVNIDEGAFENEAGASFAGLSDKTTWSFTIIAASVVSSVEVPADDYYAAGSSLDFTVNMVLPVSVTGGVPSIPVTIGEQVVSATLVGTVTASDALTFRYTIEEGQEDLDGIAIGSAMELKGASMQDEFAVDAVLALNSVGGTSGVLVDAIDPVAPVIVSVTDDTGSASDDRITNDQSLVVRGTAEANSSLSLLVDGEAIFGGVIISVDGDGNWEFDPVGEGTFTLDEGEHTYTATTTDAAGNESEVSADFDVTIDLTAPKAPAVDLSASSDSGISDTDNITNDITPTVQGVSEANAPIEILVDGSSVGNTTADASGDWSFTITTDWGDGVYDITAKATDIAGNTSEEGSALSLTIDTTVPVNVFLPPIEGDDIINNSEKTDVVVTGGTSGVADGLEVTLTFTDGVNTPVEATATVMADEWATGDVDISSLTDGDIQITAEVADLAGNEAEVALADLLLDTTSPEAPAVVSISDDSGTASDDALTNDNTLSFTGTAEANSSVEVFIDGTGIGSANADGNGDWTFDHTDTTLADAVYNVTAKATDTAGNTSAESAVLTVTVDTTAPAAPGLDLVASTDLGISNTDNLTSGNMLSFEGTAEAGSIINIFLVIEGQPAGEGAESTITGDDGNWQISVMEELASGEYPLGAVATDAAGNTSDMSEMLNLLIDQDLAISSTSPADNETDVLPNANLTVTFDKNVVKGTGNITIRQVSDDTVIETIDVTDSNVTVNGAEVTIDPVDNILPPDTEFYVAIEVGAFENEAGAPFAGISDNSTWSFTIIAASVVSSVEVPADNTYMIGDNLDFTVNMVLPVSISGTATIPVTIGSSLVTATQVGTVSNTSSILFRYTIAEDDLDTDGISIGTAMDLNGGTMQDEFGVDAILTLNGVASTASVLVDGVRPVPAISSDAVALVNGTFSATITYDEAIENFSVADMTVVNGTAGNLQNTVVGTTWTVDITPASDGMVDISLAAGTANDLAGNESKGSNTLSRDFDGTAPVVTSLNRTGTDPVNTGITELGYRLIFSEEVTGVDLSDLEIVLTGTATGALSSVIPVDATTYDITVNGVGGQGAIGVNVKTDDTITDAATNPLGSTFAGQVYTTNFIPTDIILSTSSTDENNGLTDELTTISTADADAGDSHIYTLVSGTGDTDNGSFTIDGTGLRANNLSFNFEDRASYSFRLRTDDGKGGIYEKAFTFTVNDVNEVPAMLSLSNGDIDESDNAQTVGDFSTLDQDGGDTFTYSLVSGTGDTDNAAFTISGNTLSTAGLINFEDGATRSVLVRVTDSGGLTLDRQFTINIGEVVIEPLREYETNVPGGAVRNVFSPNGDGVNETWVIEDLLDNPVNEVKVYAQGGKLIFSKVNYRNDWDGTFKGDPIPDGTYYYEINVYEGERIIKGFLTIIRNR